MSDRMGTPSLTLIIPSYKRGARIVPTLQSVARQTRRPDEVIIVNDGGDPETRRAVENTHPGFIVMDVAHGGAAAARNAGARAASGSLLMLLDDDDTLRDDAVEVLVANILTFEHAGASFGDHTFTDLATGEHHPNHFTFHSWYERLRRAKAMKAEANATLYGRGLYEALLHGNLLGQPWVVWKRVYLEIGGFQPNLGSADDWDVYLRLLRSYPVAVTSHIVSDHYREAGRSHLTTESGQREKQMEVIRREVHRSPLRDLRAQSVLRQRMGNYYKSIGDDAARSSLRLALSAYAHSMAWWPFDPVVCARTVAWGVLVASGRR